MINKIKAFLKKEEELSGKMVHEITENPLVSLINLITELGSTFAIFVILILIAIEDNPLVSIMIMPAYLAQLAIVEIIKITIRRNRPGTTNKKRRILGMKTNSNSFPSGHTANIFSLVTGLINYYSPSTTITISLILTAILISISRLYLGRHYIVDVIAGAFIGIVITWTTLILVKSFIVWLLGALLLNVNLLAL